MCVREEAGGLTLPSLLHSSPKSGPAGQGSLVPTFLIPQPMEEMLGSRREGQRDASPWGKEELGALATCPLWGEGSSHTPFQAVPGDLSSSGPGSRQERLHRQFSPAPYRGCSHLPVSPEPLIHRDIGGSHECHPLPRPQMEGGSGHVGTLALSRHWPS